MELNNRQWQALVDTLAVSLILIDGGQYDSQSGMGGVNDFQRGRAWGLFHSIALILPPHIWSPLLEAAKIKTQEMSQDEASKMWCDNKGMYDAWFQTFIHPFEPGTA